MLFGCFRVLRYAVIACFYGLGAIWISSYYFKAGIIGGRSFSVYQFDKGLGMRGVQPDDS